MSEMSEAGSSRVQPSNEVVIFSDRLWVPLWFWAIALLVAGLLAAEVHLGSPGIAAWLPYLLLVPFAAWTMVHLSRVTIEVRESAQGRVLIAGGATLPVSVVARAAVVPSTAKSAALGRQLDPAAYVVHRAWIGSMVIVVLDDPEDSTPYWLVSTRRPEELVAALTGDR